MIDIKQMLETAIESGASDVHINIGMPPIMRINTELVMMDLPEVTNDMAGKMILEMIGEDKFNKFLEKRDWDFSTMIDDGSRFRVNAHFQKESFALSFRAISNHIPDIEELHLPDVVRELTDLPRGLVVVTGHTGSGKSTSLASMVDVVNQKYRKRIITLEDPVEYLMENKSCMIEQREMGSDCTSFSSGLRHALRQDPDIILVGEMRDLETTSSTITAAETGHLVFSTLHTVNASQTVERIIDIYPASQQNQIRAMLSNTLQAVISQTLFRRVDQPGMVPCCEILLCTSAVRNCIRENRIFEIPNIIETSRRLGMQTMDHSIQQNYMKGFLDREEAIVRSSNPGKMEK
ncbi:MAG: type IV pilus twitching motility protein PilT, partial [Planctomycetota bacterium]